MSIRRIQLSDSQPLSLQEHQEAKRICDRIRAIAERRAAYIKEHHLDPEIADPGANWSKDADNAIHNLFRQVSRGEYDVLNRLRFFTQPFTGYELASMAMGDRKERVPAVGAKTGREPELVPPIPDEWVRRLQVIMRHIPQEVRLRYPVRMGEIGWELDGAVANHDIYSYQERLNLLYEAGILDLLRRRMAQRGRVNVVEIGGGYGALGYGLNQVLGQAVNYLICDLPESLLFSALYLRINLPAQSHTIYSGKEDLAGLSQSRGQFFYVPNYMFDEIVDAGVGVDLVINTLSLAEMTEAQVRSYASRVKRLLGPTGLFFEQNHDGRWVGMLDCKPILAQSFEFRQRIKPRSIPALVKGKADVWSTVPLARIIEPSARPFSNLRHRLRLFFWRGFWLVRRPAWGITRLRAFLQEHISPRWFTRVKALWNKMGGRLPA